MPSGSSGLLTGFLAIFSILGLKLSLSPSFYSGLMATMAHLNASALSLALVHSTMVVVSTLAATEVNMEMFLQILIMMRAASMWSLFLITLRTII